MYFCAEPPLPEEIQLFLGVGGGGRFTVFICEQSIVIILC